MLSLLCSAYAARAQLLVSLPALSNMQTRAIDSLDNHTVYFGTSVFANTGAIYRTSFVNGAYTTPVKIVGNVATSTQAATDGPSLAVNINLPRTMVVVYAPSPGFRRVPRAIVWMETDAPARMRVHDFATETVRTVAGYNGVASDYVNGVGTSIQFQTMTNSRLILGDDSTTLWLGTLCCIRKFVPDTGSWEGTTWLLAASRRFFHCDFALAAGDIPTFADGLQDAPAGPTRGELPNVGGMAIWWRNGAMTAVYVSDTDGAGHLRKISVSGSPRVDSISLSANSAGGPIVIIPSASTVTLYWMDSTTPNIRMVVLPDGPCSPSPCTRNTVVSSPIGAYVGACGTVHLTRRGTLLLSGQSPTNNGVLFQFQLDAPRQRVVNTYSSTLTVSPTLTTTAAETVSRLLRPTASPRQTVSNSSSTTWAARMTRSSHVTTSASTTASFSTTDGVRTHIQNVAVSFSNDTHDFYFDMKGFVLMSAGDPHYVTADDRLVTCDEFGRVVMGESRSFRVDGFHAALGDPTVLEWVNVTHVPTGASVLFRPSGPVTQGPIQNYAIVTQTAIATLDGTDYVEVTFTETPEGVFASAIAVLSEMKRGIWLRGCRVPFETNATLESADCKQLINPRIKRMCNIDAFRLGKGFAQLTTAMQTLSNNVQPSTSASGNSSALGSSGTSGRPTASAKTRTVPKSAPIGTGAVIGIAVGAVGVLALIVGGTFFLIRRTKTLPGDERATVYDGDQSAVPDTKHTSVTGDIVTEEL